MKSDFKENIRHLTWKAEAHKTANKYECGC